MAEGCSIYGANYGVAFFIYGEPLFGYGEIYGGPFFIYGGIYGERFGAHNALFVITYIGCIHFPIPAPLPDPRSSSRSSPHFPIPAPLPDPRLTS